jgi:hypothetical protein
MGCPVVCCFKVFPQQYGECILSRFLGDDLIGIVPHETIPTYCESMFPNHYGKILDFMHVYDNDIWIRDIEWLPEKEAELE